MPTPTPTFSPEEAGLRIRAAASALSEAGYDAEANDLEEGPDDGERLARWLSDRMTLLSGALLVAERHKLADAERLAEAYDLLEAARDQELERERELDEQRLEAAYAAH